LRGSDAYLVHELLEEHHSALYLSDFVAKLTQHQLSYVADAVSPLADSPDTIANDRLNTEQLLDFARMRSFRRACIVHNHSRRALQPQTPQAEYLDALRVRTHLVPPAGLQTHRVGEETFTSPLGGGLTVSDPRQKKLLQLLHRASPASVPVNQLARAILKELLQRDDLPEEWVTETQPLLNQTLRTGLMVGHIAASSNTDCFTTQLSTHPVASAWARLNLLRDIWVTNRRSETVRLSPAARMLLPQLDGTRTTAELDAIMANAIRDGTIKHQPDEHHKAEEPTATTISALTHMVLLELASHALLIR
jgi:methyltransferase-like protein